MYETGWSWENQEKAFKLNALKESYRWAVTAVIWKWQNKFKITLKLSLQCTVMSFRDEIKVKQIPCIYILSCLNIG